MIWAIASRIIYYSVNQTQELGDGCHDDKADRLKAVRPVAQVKGERPQRHIARAPFRLCRKATMLGTASYAQGERAMPSSVMSAIVVGPFQPIKPRT
jgi:hypothetical protein